MTKLKNHGRTTILSRNSKINGPLKVTVLVACTLLVSGLASPSDILQPRFTLEQKVSQLFMTYAQGRYLSNDDPEYTALVDKVENFGIGGVIFGVGDPIAQAHLTNRLQKLAWTPLLIGQDLEWGAGMRLERTTSFPPAMALGATRNPELAYKVGKATAEEAKALGVHINFAPVADINNNPNNPIINTRSFGETADLVSEMVVSFIKGLQDGGVLSIVKHFPGHGDTSIDSHADLPILPWTRARLDSLELTPFREAIEANVDGIMTAHLALPELNGDSTKPATLSPVIIEDLVRKEWGYEGLLITDAMNMQGVLKNYGIGEAAVQAIEAGNDIILMSTDVYVARRAIMKALEKGRLSEDRIDKSVERIMKAKKSLRLNQENLTSLEDMHDIVWKAEHRNLASEIARESITLLQNIGDVIPISNDSLSILNLTLATDSDREKGLTFHHALRSALPKACISRVLLNRDSRESDFEDLLSQAPEFDLILVPSFIRFSAWSGQIGFSEVHQDLIDQLEGLDVPLALLSLGNPYQAVGLDSTEVYVTTFSGSKASQRSLALALTGQSEISGKLPISIPGKFAFGDGIELNQIRPRLGSPSEARMDPAVIAEIDKLLEKAIEDKAFPAAAVAIGRSQVVTKLKGYGYTTYDSEIPVSSESLFDLASLTKVIATTSAIMKLVEDGQIKLKDRISKWVPEFGQNGKNKVTIFDVMTHTSGLEPYYEFYRRGIEDKQGVLDQIYAEKLKYKRGKEYKYSDLGMITMVEVIEAASGMGFEAYLQKNIFGPLGMNNTGFRGTGEEAIDENIVPSEDDNYFRKRLVQGEVHDENAWLLGGTSGHAGLFSNASDLAKIAQLYLNKGSYAGKQIFKPETIELFTTKVKNKIGHTRAVGWDTKSPTGYSSAGSLMGPRSFGHTGFTGTSFWIDPDADLFVILLTNRVYPTRANKKHVPIRPKVADIAYRSIVK